MQSNQFIDISQPIRVSGIPVGIPGGTYRFNLDHANTQFISFDPNDSRIKYVSTPLIPIQPRTCQPSMLQIPKISHKQYEEAMQFINSLGETVDETQCNDFGRHSTTVAWYNAIQNDKKFKEQNRLHEILNRRKRLQIIYRLKLRDRGTCSK